MDVALILPSAYLDMAAERAIHMALAHRVLEDPDYTHWFCSRAALGEYIVLDNSLIELGTAMSMADMLEAAAMCHASELILPDSFRDGEKTLRMARAAIKDLDTANANWRDSVHTMVVAHGHSNNEWLWCFDQLNSMVDVHTIGIPKVLDEVWQPGGRIGCTEYLYRTNRIRDDKKYHLLGIWTDPVEILCQARHQWIRSVDTALPFHAGCAGVKFTPYGLYHGVRPRRPHRFFDFCELDEQGALAVIHNISVLDLWSQGKPYTNGNGHVR